MDPERKGEFNRNHFERIEHLASGLLNVNKARLFVEFAMEGKDINPKDIFFNYPKIRKKIKELVKKKDNAGISKLMSGFVFYLTTTCPEYQKDGEPLKYVGEFLSGVPLDASAIFVTAIDKFGRNTKEFKYMTKMHVELMKQPVYKTNFYEAIVKLGNKE